MTLSDEPEAIARVKELELRSDDAIVRISEVNGIIEHIPERQEGSIQTVLHHMESFFLNH